LPRATQEQPGQGVYRVSTDGTVHLEDGGNSAPNGVELSPDERVLYVSYTSLNQIFRFSVAADGALSAKTSFASGVSVPDGMCVDSGGNLYVASLGGIAVFDPTGRRLGAISLTQTPTNCAFGGTDQGTFFITARSSLIGAPAPGNGSLYRIDKMPIPGMPGRP
jgi:gluconolactonase